MLPTHYQILGLPEDCSNSAIRTAFRELAKKWHPDKNRGNEAEATLAFQRINASNDILVDAGLRREYDGKLADWREQCAADEQMRADRDAFEQQPNEQTFCGGEESKEQDNQPPVSGSRKRKAADSSTIRRIFKVYFGTSFDPSMFAEVNPVQKWLKTKDIILQGTLHTTVSDLSSAGVLQYLDNVYQWGLHDEFSYGMTTTTVFLSAGRTVFTAQNLNNCTGDKVDEINSGIISYLESSTVGNKDVSIIVFAFRKTSDTRNAVNSKTEVSIQIVFGGVVHHGQHYVDNRSNNPPQSCSFYAPPTSHAGPVVVAQLHAIIVQSSTSLHRSFSVYNHIVLRVTGDVHNLSTTKTMHNYRLCAVLPPDDTELCGVGTVPVIVAVFPRNMVDSAVSLAGGSRFYQAHTQNSAMTTESAVQGLKMQMLVCWRQGKSHRCAQRFKPVNNTPAVLAHTLEKFLRDVAHTLNATVVTATMLEEAVQGWPAVNLPSNFKLTTASSPATPAGATTSKASVAAEPEQDRPRSLTESCLLELVQQTNLSSAPCVLLRAVRQQQVDHRVALPALQSALLDSSLQKGLGKGQVLLQLQMQLGEFASGKWLAVDRISVSNTDFLLCRDSGKVDVLKIGTEYFILPDTQETLTPEDVYGVPPPSLTPDEAYE